jgi:uncharacterized membrane protein YeaQ/YmgE (transglycosylase-associated protein family)
MRRQHQGWGFCWLAGELKMALWTLLVWLAVGAVAGILARNVIGGTSPFGVMGDVILGIAGGGVGGYIVALLGVSGTGGIVGSIVAAVAGAMLLIWGARKVKR